MLFSKMRDEFKLLFGVSYALLCFGVGLQACSEVSAGDAKRAAEADRLQTPALLQSNAEKDLKARGFGDINYESHKRKGLYSEMQYNAKKDGVTYLLTSWCDAQKCSEPSKRALRSEPAEAKAAALWKQNGYEVVSYGRFKLSYDLKDSTLEAVVSKDGKRYNGTTECKADKCRILKMAATV